MRQNQIYSIIWTVIFAAIGGYLQNNGWPTIAWIFFILSGMSVFTFFKS